MRALLLLALAVLAGCAIAVPTPTPAGILVPRAPAPSATASSPPAASAPLTPTAVPPLARATLPPAVPTPLDPNRGIAFGKPAGLAIGSQRYRAVMATNTTDRVKSFGVKATYKDGIQIVATEVGAVNDLMPGQSRAVLLTGTDQIPASATSIRIDVDTIVADAPTTPRAEIARKITFGPPTVMTGQDPRVEVETTNGDVAAHSLSVQGAFLRGDQLVGLGMGAVNDLAPGQVKTAGLLVMGDVAGYDRLLLAVDLVAQ